MKKRLLACLAIVAVMVGCGGGGGSSSPPAHEPLTGTYAMTGFTVEYNDGSVFNENSPGIQSWSGKMEIGPTTIIQVVTLNGVSSGGTFQYTCVWDTATTGNIHTNTNSVWFSLSNGAMTTYTGVICSGSVCFEEWDYWQKTSESYSVLSEDEARSQSTGAGTFGVESLLPR